MQHVAHWLMVHSVCPQWQTPVQRSHGRGSAVSYLTSATTMSISLSTRRTHLVAGRNCSGRNILTPHPAHSLTFWVVWHTTPSMKWNRHHTEWWELTECRLTWKLKQLLPTAKVRIMQHSFFLCLSTLYRGTLKLLRLLELHLIIDAAQSPKYS